MYVSNKKARPMVTYTQGYSTLNKGEVYYEQYKSKYHTPKGMWLVIPTEGRYLKPAQSSRLGLPLALWFVRIQARCHLCSHNSTWKSFRVAAASGHLTGTAYGQAVKP